MTVQGIINYTKEERRHARVMGWDAGCGACQRNGKSQRHRALSRYNTGLQVRVYIAVPTGDKAFISKLSEARLSSRSVMLTNQA